MADLYPYLIASLPMLHFGTKPPYSFDRFLEICSPLIPEKDLHIISTLPKAAHYADKGKRHPIIQKWIEFDTGLRNELVRIRATRKHLEPAPYLHADGYTGSSLAPALMAVNINSSILDTEKALDETRWKALEELTTGHFFDLEFLIIYAYKLLLLQRWENIRTAEGPNLMEQALHPEEG